MKFKRALNIFIVALAFLVMVGCTTNNQTSYSLTVDYNKSYGKVTYTSPNDGEKYRENTTIVVEVKPNDGYEVASFSINDNVVELTDNTYTFSIAKDTTLVVNFVAKDVSKAVFSVSVTVNPADSATYELVHAADAVDGNGKFFENSTVTLKLTLTSEYDVTSVKVNDQEVDGTNGEYPFVVTKNTVVVVTCEKVVKQMTTAALNSVSGDILFEGEYTVYYPETDEEYNIGILTIFNEDSVYQLEMEDGEVSYEIAFINHNGYCSMPSISLQNEVVYDDTDYLFDEFDNPFKDLTVNDFVFVSKGKFELTSKKDETAACITGWDETIKSFYVYVEDDKIVGLEIVTEVMESEYDTYYSSYTFIASEHGTAKTDINVTPYERVPEHEALEQALSAVHNNYTIEHRDVAEGEEDIVYNVYVDEKGIYSDYDDNGVTYGYVELDGYVYEFSYDGQTVTVGDAIAGYDSIADMQADFSVFDVALLEYVGNETYVAYDANIASALLSWIGEDYDSQSIGYYGFVTSLEIILKDGVLYQVVYEWGVSNFASTVTLTYSAFDETSIDIDFSNVEKVSVLDEFIGTYSSSKHKVVVTSSGVTIDDVDFEVLYYEDGMLYGYLGEDYIAISKLTDENLAVYNTEFAIDYIVTLEETQIPQEYIGVWEDSYGEMMVEITATGIKINGIDYVIESYDDYYGFTGTYNGISDYMVVLDYGNSLMIGTIDENYRCYKVNTGTDDPQGGIDPSHVGTYRGEKDGKTYEIIVTLDGITINGESFIINEIDEYGCYYGTYNGEEYTLEYYDSWDDEPSSFMFMSGDCSFHLECTFVE